VAVFASIQRYHPDMSEPYFDKEANTGLRHLINATRFSLNGLRIAFRKEAAFRQELAILLLALPVGWYLASSLLEFVLLIASLLLVITVELLNSAVEATVDRIGTDHHELAGEAKDLGSAAVMVSIALSLMVWLAVASQHVF